jgi:ubiquinol-cytochrome c reductase subunit 6
MLTVDCIPQVLPALREECAQTAACAPLTKHFQHCQEKIEAGNGYKHEDCIEELFQYVMTGIVS